MKPPQGYVLSPLLFTRCTHDSTISGVQQVNSYRFIGITIENISSSQITILFEKAQKRLNFLWKLRMAKFQSKILVNFYRGEIESILTENIINWHGFCKAQDRKAQQRVILTFKNIIGTHLQSTNDTRESAMFAEPRGYQNMTPNPATVCSTCNLANEHEIMSNTFTLYLVKENWAKHCRHHSKTVFKTTKGKNATEWYFIQEVS